MITNPKFNAKKRLFFLAMFILPSLFSILFYWFIIRKPIVTNNASLYKSLLYYGPKSIAENKDTVYYKVSPFKLITSNNLLFDSREFDGDIVTVNFVDLKNKTNYISQTSELLRVQKKLNYLKIVKHISVVINADLTTNQLKEFMLQAHNDEKKWIIAKANEPIALAYNNFLLHNFDTSLTNTSLPLSTYTLLLDKDKCIRGFYIGTSAAENNKMIDEIKVLAASYKIADKLKIEAANDR